MLPLWGYGADVIVGLLTTGLVAVVLWLWRTNRKLASRLQDEQASTRRVGRRSAASSWLLEYYPPRGGNDLFVTGSIAPGTRVPLYSPESWYRTPPTIGSVFNSSELRESTVVVDERVLKAFSRRISLEHEDGTPWNDEILMARAVDGNGQILLGTATYYKFLSACGGLMLETEAASAGRRRTPIRNAIGPTAADFAAGRLGAQIIGANVATVLRDGDSYTVLIQERNSRLAVHPGALNVAPVFGLSAPNALHGRVELRTQLLREYLEEFLGYEDIEQISHSRHIDSDWYLQTPDAKGLASLLDSGRATFELLGVGIDLLNGEVDLACLLLLDIDDFRENLPRMTINWEYKSIRLVDLFADELDLAVGSGLVQTGGVQALDLARKRLARD